jgi:hypothetical protein
MRRRDFIRLLGGAAVDVCIDCVQFLARGGRTGPEHQPEWSLAAIAARWGPEWVLVTTRVPRSTRCYQTTLRVRHEIQIQV